MGAGVNGLKGKRILVAGCATGIGAATAKRLAAEGASLVLGDINEAGLQAVARSVDAPWQIFDLADTESIDELVSFAVERLGGLDGVASVAADTRQSQVLRDLELLDMDPELWRHALNVNLIGLAWIANKTLPHLLETGGGSIVNVTSDATVSPYPVPVAYSASKAGINAMTRHVSSRWGKQGIRCNAVSPGAVMSEAMYAMGEEYIESMRAGSPHARLGEPEDLAATIAFLLSDDAEWVSGQVWSVNGGSYMRE